MGKRRRVVTDQSLQHEHMAVELAVDLAHGRVTWISPVSVLNAGLAVQLYQLLCDVTTRPASCRGLTSRHSLWALSALHFGISAEGAKKILPRIPVHHTII